MARVISKSGYAKKLKVPPAPKTVKHPRKTYNNNKVKKTKGGWEMSAIEALKVDYVVSEI